MSRKIRHLRRGGTEDAERESAGGGPRAPAAPDLWPAPQIPHLLATTLQSHRLDSSLPASCTPTARPAPTPEATSARRSSSLPPPSRTTTEPRGGCSPAKRRRRPPHLSPAARDPPNPHPIHTTGTQIRGSPILPPPERLAEGEESPGCAGGRWSPRSRLPNASVHCRKR